MADKADTKTTAPVETPAETVAEVKPAKTNKRVGADFSEAEYAVLRELRFTQRHDKDSGVIRAALKAYAEDKGETWPSE